MKRHSDSPLSSQKGELRRSMRLRLQGLSPAVRAEASLTICALAARQLEFRDGFCIALFVPLPLEPDVHPLIEEAWAQRKQVVLPRLIQDDDPRLEWHAVRSWAELAAPGPFGLREPDPGLCPAMAVGALDCVFVPGVAFDRNGLRLGRGGGFYDRFLSQAPPALPRLGLMFADQFLPHLHGEAHDQKLPAVITEAGVTSFASAVTGDSARSIQPPPRTSSPT